MIKYPFHKLLYYLIAISKFDRISFVENLNLYLPSIIFDYEDVFDYTKDFLSKKPLPACVLKGNDDSSGFRLYNNIFGLNDLNAVFTCEDFEDLIFDSDLRRKIDAMALSPSFRKIDIIREFSTINQNYINIYLDCFANFNLIQNRNIYISKYIGDELEKKLYQKVLSTSSRSHLKVILGIKLPDISPKDVLAKSLNIASLKTDIALLSNNDIELERWIKLQVGFAEKLHKIDSGNKSDLDALIEALDCKPTFDEPKIYSKEELESVYQNSSNALES